MLTNSNYYSDTNNTKSNEVFEQTHITRRSNGKTSNGCTKVSIFFETSKKQTSKVSEIFIFVSLIGSIFDQSEPGPLIHHKFHLFHT